MRKGFVGFLILIFAAGCSGNNQQTEEIQSDRKTENLVVYTMEEDLYADQAVGNFQKAYPETEVEVRKIPYDDLEEQRTAIAAEFMAGDGGDLYLNADDYFDDLYKMQESGLMEDLMPWFREDPDFSEEDYVDGTFNLYEDEEDYSWFAEGTKVLKTTVSEQQLDLSGANEELPESFIMYISGIDTYGGVTERSRSDVNIMAVINRNTHKILLVSTPRDYYVPLSISGGAKDKLTHAGIYGVDVSMETLEMLYGVDISYFFRLNFSGFIDMIDALGGIDVYSEKEFTVDPIATYHVGYNHLDGLEALAFARERYSFSEGDFQRGRNQMAVIQAVVEKCTSKAMLNNYTQVMESMEGCFQTSLTDADIKELVKEQLENPSGWEITSIDVTGTGSRQTTYSMPGRSVSVVIPDMDSVEAAKTEIQKVLNGE